MKKGTISALSILIGVMIGIAVIGKVDQSKLKRAEKTSGKFMALFHMMNHWVKDRQNGKNLSVYFKENNYKRIAVYGMSYVGETLLQELKGTEVEVSYGIDKKARLINSDIDIVSPDEILDNVDVVVVTVVDYFDEIKEMLKEKIKCPIISIEDIVFEV